MLPPGPLRPHDGGGGNLPAAAAAGKPGGVHSGGERRLREVFSPPCVSDAGETCRLQMCQRPAYDVARGFSQYSARNGAFCGDSACVFADGSGRLVAVLSDGMGTGGRAAVDGAMTCAMAEAC